MEEMIRDIQNFYNDIKGKTLYLSDKIKNTPEEELRDFYQFLEDVSK